MMTLTALLAGIAAALSAAPGALAAIKSLVALRKPTVTNDSGVSLTQAQVLAAIDQAFGTWQAIIDAANAQLAPPAPTV